MASFTAMQQSANDDRTTMRQLMETITRRLANPMEPIESLCITLRYPSDESTTQRRAFGVTINPPVPSANGSGFDQYWVPLFNSMPSGDVDRLHRLHQFPQECRQRRDASNDRGSGHIWLFSSHRSGPPRGLRQRRATEAPPVWHREGQAH